ncbi:MAG: hypothetical protein JSS64_10780 [Bacteroidetes bacterium]|nr:hypothetical protein [Bacteroidota bacterium]
MKKVFLLSILFVVISAFSATAMSKHVEGTITLEPCTISYSDTITYSIVPPEITGFSGTITFGGGVKER